MEQNEAVIVQPGISEVVKLSEGTLVMEKSKDKSETVTAQMKDQSIVSPASLSEDALGTNDREHHSGIVAEHDLPVELDMPRNGTDDESLTLGMQFKNKKFLIRIGNILKGKNSQEDILYGIVMKLKEKLSSLQCENQQGVIKKAEVLKMQAVTERLEKSEEKVYELKEKLRKVTSENKRAKER